MADQLTFTTLLGGETVTAPARGKHYIQPRGYAHPPGTRPKGETCGSCQHIARYHRFRKCELQRRAWSHGRGTDILAGSPACKFWEKADG